MEITVGRDRLPAGRRERENFLKNYFCEQSVSAKEVPGGWEISLGQPWGSDFYIDPDIDEGLAWWSRNYGAVDVGGIPSAVHRRPGLQLSLNDSWTIYSWSRWLEESAAPGDTPSPVTLLHLDDHDDFMAPRVLLDEGGRMLDPITGRAVDLWSAAAVESAVRSGAIGIGSFMAPFLHLFPRVHVRHLCSTEYMMARQGPYMVRPVTIVDNLLAPGSLRPALEARPAEGHGAREGAHPYDVTDDLDSWLEDLPDGPVLIHVDMDYFNNRFNGDSDWVDNGPKYDPPLADVLRRIDQVFEAVESRGVAGRVVDLAVALSPGFFPADLWAPSVGRIEEHVDRLIGAGRWLTRE